jgi:VanZ family protein
MTFLKKIQPFFPAFIWMVVIFYFSSRPDLPRNQFYLLDFLMKKSAHVIEYFILTILLAKGLGLKKSPQSVIYALIYAFSDEIHQLFVPGRTGMLRDVLVDSIGISLALISIIMFPLWRKFLFPTPTKKLEK